MDSTSFNDLPYEVQEAVGPYLEQHSLHSCVLVCRAWKTVFYPFLWRHVDILWNNDTESWNTSPGALKAHCHFTQSLRVRCTKASISGFLKSCPRHFPQLDSLELHGSDCFDWSLVLSSRIFSVAWKRLVFRQYGDRRQGTYYGAPLFERLQTFSPTLVVVHLEGCWFHVGFSVNRLLCSTPNLKELWVTGNRTEALRTWMCARDIAGSQWVCTNLEVFVCQIRTIPRPDIERYINNYYRGRPWMVNGTVQDSYDLQRRVYTQLGRLTKLRELRLGLSVDPTHYPDYQRGDREIYRQYDCLAMTLDSGLDLLKGLKELRVVGLEDMEVYIDGDEEQSWFAEHWPLATIGYEDYRED